MTLDLHDDLSMAIGRKLTNQEWTRLISENFGVSNSVAKDAHHAMLSVIATKKRGRKMTDEREH